MQQNTVEIHTLAGLKIVPSQAYRKLRLLEILSPDARLLVDWLVIRNKKIISLVEICKTGPIKLRPVHIVRELMDELSRYGFANKLENGIVL